MSVKITVLIDDINGAEKGYVLSYGFAALIEKDDKSILFDVGTKVEPLMKNLKIYGKSPSELNAIILSHNHFDHTNGLSGILTENEKIPIYIHKDWESPASYKGSLVPQRNKVVIQNARECKEICSGIFATNSHLSADYGGIHEQACFIKAKDSYILLCGCCHPGLNRFLSDREELAIPEDASLNIIGGMHGFKFSDDEVKNLNPIIKKLGLYHCTMNGQTFRTQFGNICFIGAVGQTLFFN